jgi:hypothetical protein
MRKLLHPAYFLLMLVVESHMVVIPVLACFRGMRPGRGKPADRVPDAEGRGVFMVKSRDIVVGKIKMFLYASAFLCLLMGKVLDSGLLLNLAEGLLISGIAAAAIALFVYLFRWVKRPYRIAGL